jgi:hypothetical protein
LIEKGKILGVLGLVIVVTWYIFNPLVRMFLLETVYIPEGPVTYSGLLIVSTAWSFLAPIGFILVLVSIILEIKHRFQRKENNEIWE